MVKCEKCGKFILFHVKNVNLDRKEIYVCNECYKKIEEEIAFKKLEELLKTAPKIKCPFCEKWFPKLKEEQYKITADTIALKWAVLPIWGVVSVIENKPCIQCPHCDRMIMHG